MIRGPAEYLLRFDDLSPRMSRPRWAQFRELISEFELRPILAVIPAYHECQSREEANDPAFWEEMRSLELAGATIALHGYRHLCLNQGKSLLRLHSRSEFAGVDYRVQREWVQAGAGILKRKGLHPRLWVAPRHGFDRNTLLALKDAQIEYLSDGFARAPVMRGGITWIPQQLWGPVKKNKGLWTICIHPETATASDVEALRRFLETYKGQFTSFERVIAEWPAGTLGPLEKLYEVAAQWRVQLRYTRARRRRSSR